MKKYFITALVIFATTALSAQTKAMRPAMQTRVQATTVKPMAVEVEKVKPVPPPVNKDLQSASISFTTGDDGKEKNTQMGLQLWDNNKRTAAYFNMKFDRVNGFYVIDVNSAEYFAGITVTEPMITQSSIPTGQIKTVGALPLPVLRMATPADFNNGGELRIDINPAKDHIDIWKIKKIRLRVTFNNDNGSPHTIIWNNIMLSNNSTYIDLLFDKNLNAIQ